MIVATIIPINKKRTQKKPAFPLFGPFYLLIATQKILLVL